MLRSDLELGRQPNGNQTTYNTKTLTFDPENRMTAYGTSVGATYRPDNLRASKTNASGTTMFYYDTDGEPVMETKTTGALSAIDVYAPDGLVARKLGSIWTYYSFDQ